MYVSKKKKNRSKNQCISRKNNLDKYVVKFFTDYKKYFSVKNINEEDSKKSNCQVSKHYDEK